QAACPSDICIARFTSAELTMPSEFRSHRFTVGTEEGIMISVKLLVSDVAWTVPPLVHAPFPADPCKSIAGKDHTCKAGVVVLVYVPSNSEVATVKVVLFGTVRTFSSGAYDHDPASGPL